VQVQQRQHTSATCGDLRVHAGRIAEENRLTCVGVDVGVDAPCNAAAEHRPSTVADQLLQHRPADPSANMSVGRALFVDSLEHGRTFPNQRSQRRS